MSSGCYITGTDTGVGKTLASCALLHAMRQRGLRALGMKPVASGCMRTPQGWRNEDALALLAASEPKPHYDDLNPCALPAATAPQLAAREARVDVRLETLLAAHARLAMQADWVVGEGVGGWAAPLSDMLDQAELVAALDIPVIMVVGLRLGCLSHARLTARAIEADGCRFAGWIGNTIDPQFDRLDDYLDLLHAALPTPYLGVLPHGQPPDFMTLAESLDLRSLL